MTGEAGYRAALEGVAVADRSDRGRWLVTGRDPRAMLDGILTNTIPKAVRPVSPDVVAGVGSYGMALSPKGRMVSDLRVFPWGGPAEAEAFLLDLPQAGTEPLRDHFKRFLPPRMAAVEEMTETTGMLTVVGPDAAALVAREALGLRVGEEDLVHLDEDAFLLVGSSPREGVRAVRCGEAGMFAFDVLADAGAVSAFRRRFLECGAVELDRPGWETLRVEAGRPAFGVDMDDSTIPVEAGIHQRAIDYEKGCYTGQEVIVRIRDRGHVNRYLRTLLFSGDAPSPGTELFAETRERAVGSVTSAVFSPRLGAAVGLGWVRREVEPPAELRLGEPDGPSVQVRERGPVTEGVAG